MRYMVRKSIVDVVGKIWQPYGAVCSLRKELTDDDLANARDSAGKLTRASVDRWVRLNSGDFSEIIDWRASLEDGDQTVDLPWATEDGEEMYWGTIEVDA